MKMTIQPDRKARICFFAGLVCMLAAALVWIFAVPSHYSRPSQSGTSIVSVSQPAPAQDVASKLHCSKFHDTFSQGGMPGIIDDGVCWIGKIKYGIDVFASESVRDSWLPAAEALGVVPKWETATSVTYKATDQGNNYN